MKKIVKLLSYYYKILKGKEIWIPPPKKIKRNVQWFGSEYGGFYACPELLNETSIIYSFGVGEEISFDIELIKRFSCHVYAFDPTPKSITYIEESGTIENFTFFPIGIHSEDENIQFFLPLKSEHVSCSIVNKDNTQSIIVPAKKILNDS
jgi:hypothetical protein